MLKKCLFFILFSWLFYLVPGCEKDLTPVNNTPPEIKLTVEDVGVTEAWLRLNIQDPTSMSQITISRNDSTIQSRITGHSVLDTLIYDSELLPNHNYTYTATLLTSNQNQVTSSQQITTMDTTSHDFTWEILTFGDGSSSVLNDVCIINENDIWGVGEISVLDSTGNNYINPPFNAVHWDGNEWQLHRIYAITSYGDTSRGPIRCIFAFSSDEIWTFSQAGSYSFWNGTNWHSEFVHERVGGINKIWGSSSNNLYFVGSNGNITHYDGQTWQRIESGTDLDVQDIWGALNQKTGEYEILCVASKPFEDPEHRRIIYKIKDNSVATLSDSSIVWSLSSIWFLPEKKYYVAGSGIYEKNKLTELLWRNEPHDITQYYIYEMRGTNINNVAAAGGVGELLHNNGISWKSFFNITGLGYGNYYAVDIKDNLIIAVGSEYQQAVIAIGNR